MNLKELCIKEGKLYLLEEWDKEKNLPHTPESISHSSYMSVWWKCEKGHSWQTQLKSRSASRTGCPECFRDELAKKEKRKSNFCHLGIISDYAINSLKFLGCLWHFIIDNFVRMWYCISWCLIARSDVYWCVCRLF